MLFGIPHSGEDILFNDNPAGIVLVFQFGSNRLKINSTFAKFAKHPVFD
jgi:hypothetical protein